MADGPVTIAVRLSSRQLSLIWPGLDFVVSAELTRKQLGVAAHSYPFGIQPLPAGYDSGIYSDGMMSRINRLWDVLGPKRKTGSRLHLDTFQVRSAVLAARLTLQVRRFQFRTQAEAIRGSIAARNHPVSALKIAGELKSLAERKRSELRILNIQIHQLIKTLERIAKRAVRRFVAIRSKQDLTALSREWRAHVRWIRYNLSYFKPFRLPPEFRIVQRRRIDKLVYMINEEIARLGLEAPSEKELRRIARAFVRSCRQGHQGKWDYLFMVSNREDPKAQRKLFQFFAPRIGASGKR